MCISLFAGVCALVWCVFMSVRETLSLCFGMMCVFVSVCEFAGVSVLIFWRLMCRQYIYMYDLQNKNKKNLHI